jgi:hypothetical protein
MNAIPVWLIGVIIAGFIALTLTVIYLNNLKSDHTERLIALLRSFDLSFNAIGKSTYATGIIETNKSYTFVAINISKQPGQAYDLLKMRARIDIPHLPSFYLSTTNTAKFMKSQAKLTTTDWLVQEDRFFVKINNDQFDAPRVLDSLSADTRALIDKFETAYEGVLIYSVDEKLFGMEDQMMLREMPDLEGESVLFTHYHITPTATQEEVEAFVKDSIRLSIALERDFKALAPDQESAAKPKALFKASK